MVFDFLAVHAVLLFGEEEVMEWGAGEMRGGGGGGEKGSGRKV